ncbi:MAG TPA: sigma-70 family RNA polymerase sigma factor [Candidatus Paceibacterota bacterium]|nr:sigma-70 family RNA polymerase sigma factor [Candidatus Paceibacterota bacterium]
MKDYRQQLLAAYEQYADALFRYCYVRLQDRELAKDAVQEAYTRTWRWLTDGNEPRNLRALLYRTAANISIDELRRGRTESLDALTEQGADIADPSATDPSVAARLAEALTLVNRLEPKYRDALLMRHVDDMPVKDIAIVLGESENAVSVRIHRAIAKLKELHDHA